MGGFDGSETVNLIGHIYTRKRRWRKPVETGHASTNQQDS